MSESQAQSPSLNSAQRSALQSHYESQLREIVSALQLRKWLVEQLLSKPIGATGTADDFLATAERLHAFIVDPALRSLSSDLTK